MSYIDPEHCYNNKPHELKIFRYKEDGTTRSTRMRHLRVVGMNAQEFKKLIKKHNERVRQKTIMEELIGEEA